jgi:CRP/FNR family transcriptional regulator, cyclic AMP receptor protein
MGVDELVSVLEKVDLFHNLRHRVLRRIAEAGREESFAAGDPVIVQGEEVSGFRSFSPQGVEMHVVLTGSADALVDGRPHGRIGPGEYFGELSLVDGLPRSAEVRAGPDDLRDLQVDLRRPHGGPPRGRGADAARHGGQAARR